MSYNHDITKEFTFNAAHMLPGHEGKCANLHGHTWRVQFTIRGRLKEAGSDEGMVMDFGEFEPIIKQLKGLYDHTFIHGMSDEELIVAGKLGDMGQKTTCFTFRTTCENIAKHIFRMLTSMWSLNVMGVTVYETETQSASYSED